MQRLRIFMALGCAMGAGGAVAAPRGLDPLVIPGVGAEPSPQGRLPRTMVRIDNGALTLQPQPSQMLAPQPYAPPHYAPQIAGPQRGAGLGGGLIEALVTGGEPAPRRTVIFNRPPPPRAAAPVLRQASLGEPMAAPRRMVDPSYLRSEVDYDGRERPGTIVVDTPNKYLYLVQPGGRAIRYGIGVGRPGFTWSGVKHVTRKAEWPAWTPPPEMLRRRPDLPRHMDGGPANPLGARALYLGSSLYRIHGTNEPHTIGQNVSSGCIRMMNDDVTDLYGRVGVGTRVIVM